MLSEIEEFFNNPLPAGDGPSLPAELSLAGFARAKGVVLDGSRRAFCDYHEGVLSDLAQGRMRGRNRFRELLLGAKSCGKTALLRVVHDYCLYRHRESVIPVSIAYLRNHDRPIDTVCSALSQRFPEHAQWVKYIVAQEQATKRAQCLDKLLAKLDVNIMLLVDEFVNVYQLQAERGVPIVDEICAIVDSNEGRVHCIVTGDGSLLRRLTTAKMQRHADFPSYTKLDMNATKLVPRSIFSFWNAQEFHPYTSVFRTMCVTLFRQTKRSSHSCPSH